MTVYKKKRIKSLKKKRIPLKNALGKTALSSTKKKQRALRIKIRKDAEGCERMEKDAEG